MHHRGRSLVRLLIAAALLSLAVPAVAAAAVRGDFDGDGHADLAVGAPQDSVQGRDQAGAVNVLYGSRHGVTAHGDQQFTEGTAGVAGVPTPMAHFGAALAVGDLNGDGYARPGDRGARTRAPAAS